MMDLSIDFSAYHDLALLALRFSVAAVFLVHGFGKLKASKAASEGLGMPQSGVIVLGLVEVISGLLVLVGFSVSWAALAQMIILLGAMYYKIAKWHIPFMAMQATGWELDVVLFTASCALAAFGGGSYVLF